MVEAVVVVYSTLVHARCSDLCRAQPSDRDLKGPIEKYCDVKENGRLQSACELMELGLELRSSSKLRSDTTLLLLGKVLPLSGDPLLDMAASCERDLT